MKLLFVFLIQCALFTGLAAQSDGISRVFMMGEKEGEYENLKKQYQQSLLQACDNRIEKASGKWLQLLKAMEDYSKTIDFDLKGLKLWLHVFWAADGSIEHIGFFLRPDSRNLDLKELKAFFTSFLNQGGHQTEVETVGKFAKYARASFPVYSQRMEKD